MRNRKTFKISLFSISLLFCMNISFAKTVWNGFVQVISPDTLSDRLVVLDGEWEFYPSQEFSTLNGVEANISFVQVPERWSAFNFGRDKIKKGIATYRLKIHGLKPSHNYAIYSKKSPMTSCELYANGKLIKSFGKTNANIENYKACVRPLFSELQSNKYGELEIVVKVANHVYHQEGITSPVMLGEVKKVRTLYFHEIIIHCIMMGAVIFLMMVNFIIYINDRAQEINLLFGLMLASIFIKILDSNFCFPSWIMPSFNFTLQTKLEYLMAWLCSALFSLIFNLDKPFAEKHPNTGLIIFSFFIIIGLAFSFVPLSIQYPFEILIIAGNALFSIYTIFRIVFGIRKHQFRPVCYMFFYLIVAIPAIIESVVISRIFYGIFDISDIGIIILIMMDLGYLSFRYHSLLKQNIELITMERRQNKVYKKFISEKFINMLGKTNSTEILLGDYNEITACVIYILMETDIPAGRNIRPELEFETVNFYVKNICSIIEINNGFVSNIFGSGMMAIFHNGTNDAINAAYSIQKQVQHLNAIRSEEYYLCVKCHGGIDCGKLIIGTLGTEKRMTNTAISDVVNTSCRISNTAKDLQVPFLISDSTIKHIKGPMPHKVESIGPVKLRGKITSSVLYKIPLEEDDITRQRVHAQDAPQSENARNIDNVEEVEELIEELEEL